MKVKEREMFLTATNFLASADFCYNAKDSFYRGFNTPIIVSYSLACEIYLKLLLLNQGLKNIKTHNINKLYQKLTDDRKNYIEIQLLNNGHGLKDAFGINQIEKISEYFIKWRYCYEHSNLMGNISFIKTLADILREICRGIVFI